MNPAYDDISRIPDPGVVILQQQIISPEKNVCSFGIAKGRKTQIKRFTSTAILISKVFGYDRWTEAERLRTAEQDIRFIDAIGETAFSV